MPSRSCVLKYLPYIKVVGPKWLRTEINDIIKNNYYVLGVRFFEYIVYYIYCKEILIMKISAKMFFELFKSRITKDKFWDLYRNNSEFTAEVTKEINAVIEEMGCQSQNEYFRIDATGWQGRYKEIEGEAKEIGMRAHLWDLIIAVEHENNPKDWTDELIKLVHIRCPLKVIIGYNYYDQRDSREIKKLEYAAKWINKTKAFNSNGKEEYLIILGNCHSKDKEMSYKEFDYRGYLYCPTIKKFTEL